MCDIVMAILNVYSTSKNKWMFLTKWIDCLIHHFWHQIQEIVSSSDLNSRMQFSSRFQRRELHKSPGPSGTWPRPHHGHKSYQLHGRPVIMGHARCQAFGEQRVTWLIVAWSNLAILYFRRAGKPWGGSFRLMISSTLIWSTQNSSRTENRFPSSGGSGFTR